MVAGLPDSVAEEWRKLRPLVEAAADDGIDYDAVAALMGWTRDYAKKRLSRLRLRYRLPIPARVESGCWGTCPECGEPLQVWLDGRWCSNCGWDEAAGSQRD